MLAKSGYFRSPIVASKHFNMFLNEGEMNYLGKKFLRDKHVLVARFCDEKKNQIMTTTTNCDQIVYQ